MVDFVISFSGRIREFFLSFSSPIANNAGTGCFDLFTRNFVELNRTKKLVIKFLLAVCGIRWFYVMALIYKTM